ncbi:MAG: glycosyltransferase family 2 protein [Marinobacter sp.]|nr:glycosyltransferase family 2 protein [Marinobacter sp.]
MNLSEGGKGMEQQSRTEMSLKAGDPVPKSPRPCSEEEITIGWEADLDAPMVSVVCHTYNHEKFIADALNGFLAQVTTFPFEIIVHDDASTDNTPEVIRKYASRYPKIIRLILQTENIYQKGLRPPMFSFPKARGKYIAFCEGDDYWIDKKKLEVQVSFLENNPDYVLCYTDAVAFSSGVVLKRESAAKKVDLSGDELKKAPAIHTLTSCFRNVIDSPPELSVVRYGDKFIWSRLGRYGKGKYLGSIAPSLYRVHPGGIHSSSTAPARKVMDLQTYVAMATYYKRLGEEDLYVYFLDQSIRQVYDIEGVGSSFVAVVRCLSRWWDFSRKGMRFCFRKFRSILYYFIRRNRAQEE